MNKKQFLFAVCYLDFVGIMLYTFDLTRCEFDSLTIGINSC